MTITFQKPVTAKRGADTAYVFRIETERPLTAETENVVAACAQNPLYLNELLTVFLDSCSSYFKNKTTVANVLKLLKHEVPEPSVPELACSLNQRFNGHEVTVSSVPELAAPYTMTPTEIVICKGLFYLNWKITGEILQLDFPVDTEELLDNTSATLLRPTDADQIPFADTNEVIHIAPQNATFSRTELDRTRVKEAQLRAKLAVYKANRAHLEYVEKYGEEPSDSEDDEEDDDSEDSNDSESESE
jgi:hypothetical protein